MNSVDFATRMENLSAPSTSTKKSTSPKKSPRKNRLESAPVLQLSREGIQLKNQQDGSLIRQLHLPHMKQQQIANLMDDVQLYRVVQKFQPTHIHDVKKKKLPDCKPPDDVIMHLAIKPGVDVTDEGLHKLISK